MVVSPNYLCANLQHQHVTKTVPSCKTQSADPRTSIASISFKIKSSKFSVGAGSTGVDGAVAAASTSMTGGDDDIAAMALLLGDDDSDATA